MPKDLALYVGILLVASLILMCASPVFWVLSKIFKSQRLRTLAEFSLLGFIGIFGCVMLILVMMSQVYKAA